MLKVVPTAAMSDAQVRVRVGGMPRPIIRRNSLPCTVRVSQTKVMQSKGWLSVECYLTEYPSVGLKIAK